MRLSNKLAIVTGAASGFGAGVARRFAEEGARVIVNDLNPQGERVAKDIGGRTLVTRRIRRVDAQILDEGVFGLAIERVLLFSTRAPAMERRDDEENDRGEDRQPPFGRTHAADEV